jgi:hypothetical protein
MMTLCMNYPHSIRLVKANFPYVERHSGDFFGRAVDNSFTLWITPGKCRTNPENVGLNPENVGIERLSKTAESPTSTGFSASPRARARKQKKQESRNRARKPARGTLRVPPASRLPLPLSSPRKRGRQVPRKPSKLDPCSQEKAAPQLDGHKKRSSEKEPGQPPALR